MTTDHQEIRQWAESVNGTPELIDHPEGEADQVGIRISIPGNTDGETLSESHPPTHISWEEFFRIFEEQGLVFVYKYQTDIGDPSSWYHFAKRNVETATL